MEQNMVQFSVKIGQKDLYRFLIYNVYHNVQGIAIVFVSLLAWIMLILGWQTSSIKVKLLLAVIGLFYLVFTPINLWFRAKRQANSEVFSRPLHFEFGEEEIHVHSGTEEAVLTWENIYKVVSRRHSLLLYTNRIYAYTIPKKQTEDKWRRVVAMAEEHHCKISA